MGKRQTIIFAGAEDEKKRKAKNQVMSYIIHHKALLTAVKSMLTVCGQTKLFFFFEESKEIK